MKFRTLLDISLLLIFLLGAGYAASIYLGEDEVPELQLPDTPVQSVTKNSAGDSVTRQKLLQTIEDTRPGDTADNWYPEALSNRWKHINIYQNNQLSGNSKSLTVEYQNKELPESPDFHFILNNGFGGEDGGVTVTELWLQQRDSTLTPDREKNHQNIRICLIGDFSVQPPTQKQIASLKALLNYLYSSTAIKTYNTKYQPLNATDIAEPVYLPLAKIIKTRF